MRSFLSDLREILTRNGLKLRSEIHRCNNTAAKPLMVLVPREGLEPTRPYGQRILKTLEAASRSLPKRYEPVFTRLVVVKGSLRLTTYQHVRPPSWPHLERWSIQCHDCERRAIQHYSMKPPHLAW